MWDARAIANQILTFADGDGHSLTSMSLLKILYFSQGWHLATLGTPLVAQPFEAWKYGPVVRVVYDQIREYGKKPISNKLKIFDIATADYVDASVILPDESSDVLFNTFLYYGKFHAYTLSDLTHERGSPWERVWNEADRRAIPGMIIPNEQIHSWFLRERPLNS